MTYEQYLLNTAKEKFDNMAKAYAFVREEYETYLDGLYRNPTDWLKVYEENIEWMYHDLYKYYSSKGDKTVYIEAVKKNRWVFVGIGFLIITTVIILIYKYHGKKK